MGLFSFCILLADPFSSYFPAASADYCRQLHRQYGFGFHIVRPRRTRLGDFRVFPTGQIRITVNANLNIYAFLITYVHEVAHADVYLTHKLQRRKNLKPHGTAWQTAFRRLMVPLLTEAVFPASILVPLREYLSKPAATTYANPALMLALRQADSQPDSNPDINRRLLRDVPVGSSFLFNKKTFIRGTLRRTRVVCKEVSSGKSYAILAHAWVETDQ